LATQVRNVSLAVDGTVVYRAKRPVFAAMTWFDRSGRRSGTLGEPGPYQMVVLSPSGRHVTVVKGDQTDDWDLWDVDRTTGVTARLTTSAGLDTDPTWAPNERSLSFTSARLGQVTPFVMDLVSGRQEPLGTVHEPTVVNQWTPDGRFVITQRFGGRTIYAVPMNGERSSQVLDDSPNTKDEVQVSPNSKWVAFNSDESGRWEVYVASFPGFTSKQQVSAAGGVQPHWRADARELFYLAPDGAMMSVRVDTHDSPVFSTPSRLFSTRLTAIPYLAQYAVTADGEHFLGLEEPTLTGNVLTFLINRFHSSESSLWQR